jgi:small GTP-binding protein
MAVAVKRRIRNVGILAHVDAGKTTLTEAMLHASGSIAKAGKVDKGTSLSDTLDIERRRGISVRASTLSFVWDNVCFQLLDTPGHVDFSAEVERSLRVLDAAVLVVSAVEGIQTQTETIWRALTARGLPVLVFVNKIDRMGADASAVVAAMQAELSADLLWLNRASGIEDDAVAVDLNEIELAQLIETIAASDETLLDVWLADDGNVTPEQWHPALARSAGERRLFPVFCGAAKNGEGVGELLTAMVQYLPDASVCSDEPLSAVVYRLDHDLKLGRVAGVRLFAGRLQTRDRIENYTAGRQEQVTQIKRIRLGRYEDAAELSAGDIGFLCGLPEVRIGDILGDPSVVPGGYTMTAPLLSVQVTPTDVADFAALAAALQQLSSEDPHLDFRWFQDERELHVRIMGVIQTEILTELLQTRFGLEAQFSPATVIYKETPVTSGEGSESYTMPKPCWAIVRFLVEPLPRGSGVEYNAQIDKIDVHPKYQNEVAQRIQHALEQGPKGWEVTDLSIIFVEGCHHLLHSRSGDFKLATDMAILKALVETETKLLEPMLSFRITAPESFIGKVTGDVIGMRGTFEPAAIDKGQFILRGRIPLATSMEYAIRLSSITGGRGALFSEFDGYDDCPPGLGATRDYKGISPLDRSKYILWWRGAIKDSIRG